MPVKPELVAYDPKSYPLLSSITGVNWLPFSNISLDGPPVIYCIASTLYKLTPAKSLSLSGRLIVCSLQVHTNRATWEGGALHVRPHHQGAEPHGCPNCPANLCKGKVSGPLHLNQYPFHSLPTIASTSLYRSWYCYICPLNHILHPLQRCACFCGGSLAEQKQS